MSTPLRPPFVFVDVDTQRDFLEPGGTLFLGGSGRIRGNLGRLTRLASEHCIPVLATACAHTDDEEDPEPFPPHCLVGTPGQARIDETRVEGPEVAVVGPAGRYLPVAGGPLPRHLTIEKTRYDVFSHPGADELVRSYAKALGDPTFVVYGVATDYCVACAVRGLLERGLRVVVVADAVHPVDQEAEAEVLTGFIRAGAVLTNTAEVERAARMG
jgi:nicotinamidase/pyrazinamidase